MSSLDFLSPDRAKPDAGFTPVLKSSLERLEREAGATFEERDGWLVPVSFPGEADRLGAAGIADLSHLGKIEVRGTGGPLDDGKAVVWYQMRPDRAIVLCPYRDCFLLRSKLARRFPLVLDQTGAYGILALAGPQAGSVLRRLTHLHELPASGSVAHISAHVLERDGGYWIVFPQEYGHYLWEVALDAAQPFGGGPIGVDAATGSRS
jgi:glycine cleavage system aminomethyltransferase T